MPIYEYRCSACGRAFSKFFRSIGSVEQTACPHCQSGDVSRLVSRFAVARSEERILEDMSMPGGLGDVDENDPRSVARWMRRMGREMGDDAGVDFNEMVERMEAGEGPPEGMGMGPDGFGGGMDDAF